MRKPADWLTRAEAAEYLGLSARTLEGWAYRRGPEFKKFGSRVMYCIDDLRAWAKAQVAK